MLSRGRDVDDVACVVHLNDVGVVAVAQDGVGPVEAFDDGDVGAGDEDDSVDGAWVSLGCCPNV